MSNPHLARCLMLHSNYGDITVPSPSPSNGEYSLIHRETDMSILFLLPGRKGYTVDWLGDGNVYVCEMGSG